MKTLLILIIVAVILVSCYARKEIQVEMVSAQLIRIDTVHRYSEDDDKQVLTWRDDQNVEYVSYVPMRSSYQVGIRMAFLKTR